MIVNKSKIVVIKINTQWNFTKKEVDDGRITIQKIDKEKYNEEDNIKTHNMEKLLSCHSMDRHHKRFAQYIKLRLIIKQVFVP